MNELDELKLKILTSKDPDETEALMRRFLELQRGEAPPKAERKYPEPKRPDPRSVSSRASIQTLRATCERLRDRIVGAENEEEKAALIREMDQVQSDIAALRAEKEAIVAIEAEPATVWWDGLSSNARSEIVVSLLEKAEEAQNGGMVGYYRAMMDFIRSGKPLSARDVIRIRKAYR